MGIDYFEELAFVFYNVYDCAEYEATREYTIPNCPFCNARANSEGDYIHLEGNEH